MANLHLHDCLQDCSQDCSQPELGKLERVRYFPRQLLTADDMVTDQDYFRQKLRRHNRFLHGWGTVCGLEVTPEPTSDLSWRVRISAGYALGPYGDEIFVAHPVFLDLAHCGPGAATDPCEPDLLHQGQSGTGAPIYIAIKYAECLAKPVRAMPAGCACEEVACEYSRIRDSFQIECLGEPPTPHPSGPLLCDLRKSRQLAPCPPCPTDPWVVLAEVSLPASPSIKIAATDIDNITVRRQIYSTALLQEQLIHCCCAPRTVRPARVTSIEPVNGAVFDPDVDALPDTIVIKFDKSLRGETVNTPATGVQVTVSVEGAAQSVHGTVKYDDATRSARFTPEKSFGPDTYMIVVRGDDPDPIRDVDDLALDGNDDGHPGGNRTSKFEIREIPS